MHELATSDAFILLTGLASLAGLGVSAWTLVIARRLYRAKVELVHLPTLHQQLAECVDELTQVLQHAPVEASEIGRLRGKIVAISEDAIRHTDAPPIRHVTRELAELRTEPLDARTGQVLLECGTRLAYHLESQSRLNTFQA